VPCLNNEHTDSFILCAVTFENRVKCNVIASETEAQEGVLKVEEFVLNFGLESSSFYVILGSKSFARLALISFQGE
jgi:hypothetical protein